jgi:hypothetical protein
MNNDLQTNEFYWEDELKKSSLEAIWPDIIDADIAFEQEFPNICWAIEEAERLKEKDRLARGASRGRALLYSVGLAIGGAACLPLVGLGLGLVIATLVAETNDN